MSTARRTGRPRRGVLRAIFLVALVGTTLTVVGGASGAPSPPATTERVSLGTAAGRTSEGNNRSFEPSISSADGRFVAFTSAATNLVEGQVSGGSTLNVYRYDRKERRTVLVSEAFSTSVTPSATTPTTSASGLGSLLQIVPSVVSGLTQTLMPSSTTSTTARPASVSSQAVSIVAPRLTGDGDSTEPSISADGRYVAFTSRARNLVGPGGGFVGAEDDVFVRDMESRTTTAVSAIACSGSGEFSCQMILGLGNRHPAISADGRWVAFSSNRPTDRAWGVFVADRTNATGLEEVSVPQGPIQSCVTTTTSTTTSGITLPPRRCDSSRNDKPAISANGNLVAFQSDARDLVPGDTNGTGDVFVRDRERRATTRVSVDDGGGQLSASSGQPSISGDGQRIAFVTAAGIDPDDRNGSDDVYVRGNNTVPIRIGPGSTTTDRVSVSGSGGDLDRPSSGPAISADGRWVAWVSSARNVVEGSPGCRAPYIMGSLLIECPDVLVREWPGGRTERTSVASSGALANGTSGHPSISGDGRGVAFESSATNLVDGDTNNVSDAFVHDRPPELVVTPDPGSFPPTRAGATSTRTFTAENRGVGSLTISAVAVRGASEFTKTDDRCSNQVLRRGATCTVLVTFTPASSSASASSAELAFTHDAPGSPYVVPMSGRSTSPRFSVTPDPGEFGSRLVGASRRMTFRVTNAGDAPLAIARVAVEGDAATDFQLVGNGGPCTARPVAPRATCEVVVDFKPTAEGGRTAQLVFSDDAPGNPHRVVLRGAGTAAGIQVSPNPADFGRAVVGRPAPLTFDVRSTGTAPLAVSKIAFEGANAGDYAMAKDGDRCSGRSLNPQTACTVAVTFTPAQPGDRPAELVFTDNATGSPHRVSLRGTGTVPGIEVAPSPGDFGTAALGTPRKMTFTARSVGDAPLTISKVAVVGPDASDFEVGTQNCVGSRLVPAASCTVEVTFAASRENGRVSDLVFTDDAPGSPHRVPLGGDGVLPPKDPAITVTPDPGDYGPQTVGTTTRMTFTARSEGEKALKISRVALEGPDRGDFRIMGESEACTDATLPKGAACTVVVAFTPSTAGNRSAQLVFTDNAPRSPHRVVLRGDGLAALAEPPAGPDASTPRITLDPPVAPTGSVVTVRGSGFAPNATVNLRWLPGMGTGSATTDNQGNFEASMLVFRHDELGWRQLEGSDGRSPAARANELVVAPEVEARRFVQRG